MKRTGWVFLVVGILSLLGGLTKGKILTGPLFCVVLGAYLIHRANEKIKEEDERDKWLNNK